jgi:hypothetical protein
MEPQFERTIKLRHITFVRKGLEPFENYDVGMTATFDDAIADMLIRERFAKESKPQVQETRLVRFVRSDRVGVHGCYARGELAGFPAHVADALVAQGFATLHDAGNGPGVPLTNEQAGVSHGQEISESDSAYVARGGKPEGARDQAAVEALIASRVPAKGKLRSALGV